MYYLLIALFVCLVFSSGCKTKKKPVRSNILFIYTDDQRQDASGFNGNPVIKTPVLDEYANQGVRFSNANVVFSLCSPSRAALLTGRYGSANGVLDLGSDLNPNEKTVAQYLHDDGYLTGLSGKWHIGRNPRDAGFDFSVWFEGNGTYYGRTIHDQGRTVNPEIHCDQYCVNRSVDFLKDAVKEGRPFFLFHNTQLPHMDGQMLWNARQETKAKYQVSEMPVPKNLSDDLKGKPEYLKSVRNRVQAKVYGYPDPEAVQKHTRDYYAVITEMDDFLGELFRTIDELGLRENTYVFFMSDNGWMLGEHGMTSKVLPYRPSTHVPFFVLGPGLQSSVNDGLILNIDMAPTILELAMVKNTANMHGKSMVPLLKGKVNGWRNSFVYEGLGDYGGAKPNLTVLSKNYRFIETYEDARLEMVIFRELYDQRSDQEELHNLVDDNHLNKIVGDFQKEISIHKHDVLKGDKKND